MEFKGVTIIMVTDVNAAAQIPDCFLSGEDYPLLVDIWDNKEDAVYDDLPPKE